MESRKFAAGRILSAAVLITATFFFSGHMRASPAEAQTRAAVYFINNSASAPRNGVTILLENVAVAVTVANLGGKYHRAYYLVGTNAGKASFSSTMRAALSNYGNVDVFLAAHGSGGPAYGYFNAFYGVDAVDSTFLTSYITYALPASVRTRLRSVYQMNCFGYSLNSTWRSMGASVVSGARSISANAVTEFPAWTFLWGWNFDYTAARDLSWGVSWWYDQGQSSIPGVPLDSYKVLTGYGARRITY